MTTKTTKKVTKKVTKMPGTKRIAFTEGQVKTMAAFYEKQGKKVPAFLAKKLA